MTSKVTYVTFFFILRIVQLSVHNAVVEYLNAKHMEFTSEIDRHNFKQHLIEGALYISTTSFLSPQTMFPVLVKRLGGGDLALGAIPVIVYLAYFIPQLLSANYFAKARYRKPFVLGGGLIQRMHIFMLALTIGFLGVTHPSLALIFVFCLYAMSQILSGSVSPLWTEFIAKTNSPAHFGKLLGLRNSLGAAIGIMNGFILTLLLGSFRVSLELCLCLHSCISSADGFFGCAALYQRGKRIHEGASGSCTRIDSKDHSDCPEKFCLPNVFVFCCFFNIELHFLCVFYSFGDAKIFFKRILCRRFYRYYCLWTDRERRRTWMAFRRQGEPNSIDGFWRVAGSCDRPFSLDACFCVHLFCVLPDGREFGAGNHAEISLCGGLRPCR